MKKKEKGKPQTAEEKYRDGTPEYRARIDSITRQILELLDTRTPQVRR